jgi:hypothetical protein
LDWSMTVRRIAAPALAAMVPIVKRSLAPKGCRWAPHARGGTIAGGR